MRPKSPNHVSWKLSLIVIITACPLKVGDFRKLMALDDDVPAVHCDSWGLKRLFSHVLRRWLAGAALPQVASRFDKDLVCFLMMDNPNHGFGIMILDPSLNWLDNQ